MLPVYFSFQFKFSKTKIEKQINLSENSAGSNQNDKIISENYSQIYSSSHL